SIDRIVGKAVPIAEVVEMNELRGERVADDTVQAPGTSPYPHGTRAVDVDRIDRGATQRAGPRIMLEGKESPRSGVQDIQAPAIGAYPQPPARVLRERRDASGRQAPRVGGIRLVALEPPGRGIQSRQPPAVGP